MAAPIIALRNDSGLLPFRRRVARAAIVFTAAIAALCCSASASAQAINVVNLSHSFVPGPYSAIAADPSNPDRIAVANEHGEVSFSVDGGHLANESHAILHRRYDAMAIRAGSRAPLSSAHPKEQRATRLFLMQMLNGLPKPRWTHWMALSEPVTQISDISLPVVHGDLWVAGPAGILLGADNGAVWHRLLGGPGPMMKEKDMYGMSVVVDPSNPKTVLAGTDRGVFISDDGGQNFRHHRSKALQDRFIVRWYWDPSSPDLLFAVDTWEVLLSEDHGKNFESVFAAGGEIRDLNMAGDAVHIATSQGLYIVGGEGTRHVLPKKDILGGVGLEGGSSLALTKEALYWIGPDDRIVQVVSTNPSDPYLRLVGGGSQAWVLSKHAVLRVGPPLERSRDPDYQAPEILMTLPELERAVLRHTELGAPFDTRMHQRWYSKWVPRVVLNVEGQIDGDQHIMFDGTFPVRYRQAYAKSSDEVQYSVMAFWDLSRFVRLSNTANPNAFIESNLRENRKMMLAEVRWRYRECAALVKQLRSAPADPVLELSWKTRLAEYAAYLEFMSGREVLAMKME